MIQVMIADDHRVVAEGVAKLLNGSDDIRVTAIAASLSETRNLLPTVQPQVLLLDVALPDGDGIDAIPELRRLCEEMKIIMLTMFAEASVVKRALGAKADGYLFKTANADELAEAVREVMAGGSCLTSEAKRLLANPGEHILSLTRRERQILSLLAEGYTMKEIGVKLSLSFETVHSYMKSLRAKMGCSNAASMVKTAIEQHWI